MEQPDYNAQTPIAQIMTGSPLAVRLLLDQRAACPGCCMRAFCTLEDVCKNHHIDMQTFLSQLQPPKSTPPAPQPPHPLRDGQ
jgi:hypothetical protein